VTDPDAPAAGARTHVRVLHGAPDDDELAALVAGIVAASSHADQVAFDEAESTGPRSAWSDRSRDVRARHVRSAPGVDAWRWSLRG